MKSRSRDVRSTRREVQEMKRGNVGWSEAIEELTADALADDATFPASCAECGAESTRDSMHALYCTDCIGKHFGPIQTEPWAALVRDLCPEGIEQCCDECGGDPQQCYAGCPYPKARAMLAAMKTGPREADLTHSYAEGRKDERELWRPVLEALQKLLGPQDDPNAGWRGNGTHEEYRCEYCDAMHSDCSAIPHGPTCPIPFARAALTRATTP